MLTLQFIPHNQIINLDSQERIKKILGFVKQEKIVVLEGRLRDEEEGELIKKTMESIDERFTGIELGVIKPESKDDSFYQKVQKILVRLLLGNREGFTIIGPANIIKEIKKDPDKIELYTTDKPKFQKKKDKDKGKVDKISSEKEISTKKEEIKK